MTFTYSPAASPTDTTKIRYYIGDTVEAAAIFSDEEIAMVLEIEGSVSTAAVSLVQSAIAKLAHEPDMRADWLSVQWRTSSENWRKLLSDLQKKFGLGPRALSGGVHLYRADSYQSEEPDWDDIFAGEWDEIGMCWYGAYWFGY